MKFNLIVIFIVSTIPLSIFDPDLSTPKIMTTLDDVFKLLKQTEESRAMERAKDKEELVNEKVKDKNERAEEMENLTKSITGLIRSGVKDEVESALKPVTDMQTTIQDEHSKLCETVALLQEQFVTFQATTTHQEPPENSSNPPVRGIHNSIGVKDMNGKNTTSDIVRVAKRVLGFSPITSDHIEQAKSEYDITDEDEAKAAAVKDMLYYEMKIPHAKIKSLKLIRVFRSTTHLDRLYAEFEEESLVHFIYSFARFLSPGIHLHLYIPHPFLQRYLAIKNIEYPIRKGPGNYKTKIKFGFDDLILSKRSPTDPNWTTVPLCTTDLPPIGESNAIPLSNSPAIGRSRSRVLKRKERSPLDSSRDQTSKSIHSTSPLADSSDKTKSPSPNSLSTQEEDSLKTPDNKNEEKTPSKTDSSVTSVRDIGSFHPSACVTPSANLNKNFTFGPSKSGIPTMKNYLN